MARSLAEFKAKIIAALSLKQFNADIAALQSSKTTIDITPALDTEALKKQLATIPSSEDIHLNLDIADFSAKMSAAEAHVKRLKTLLAGLKIPTVPGGGVGAAVKDYENLARMLEKLRSLKVQEAGLDKGKYPTQAAELNAQIGQVESKYKSLYGSVTLSTEQTEKLNAIIEDTRNKVDLINARMHDISINEGLISDAKDVETAYQTILSLTGKLSSAMVAQANKDPNSKMYQILQERIDELQKEIGVWKSLYTAQFNASQLSGVAGAEKGLNARVETRNAFLDDSRIKKTRAELEKLIIAFEKLRAVGNTEQANVIKKQIDELESELNKYASEVAAMPATSVPVDKAAILSKHLDELAPKLDEIKAKMEHTFSQKEITNEIDTAIAQQTAGFDSLGGEKNANLDKVKSDLAELSTLAENFKNETDIDAKAEAYAKFSETLKKVKNGLTEASAQSKTFTSNLELQDLDARIVTWMRDNSKAADKYGERLEELRRKLQALSAGDFKSGMKEIKEAFEGIKNEAQISGDVGDSFGARLKKTFANITRYFSAASILYKGINSLKQMARYVVEIDTSMTGLKRVTDLSAAAYENLYNKMVVSAQKYGATLKDIIDATTTWAKLGFNAALAQKLGDITVMYQHVTDLDSSTAVGNLVSAYKAFRKQLLQLTNNDTAAAVERVADIFDKLGKTLLPMKSYIG